MAPAPRRGIVPRFGQPSRRSPIRRRSTRKDDVFWGSAERLSAWLRRRCQRLPSKKRPRDKGVCTREAGRNGDRNGRPAARPRRRVDDLDLRGCSPPATPRPWGRRSPRAASTSPTAPERAPALVLERREPRCPPPRLRESDHRGGEGVVPERRPVGQPGRHDRRPHRDGAGLPLLPEEGRGERAPGCLPRPDTGEAGGKETAQPAPVHVPAPGKGPAIVGGHVSRPEELE
jgi:hypothetical protein